MLDQTEEIKKTEKLQCNKEFVAFSSQSLTQTEAHTRTHSHCLHERDHLSIFIFIRLQIMCLFPPISVVWNCMLGSMGFRRRREQGKTSMCVNVCEYVNTKIVHPISHDHSRVYPWQNGIKNNLWKNFLEKSAWVRSGSVAVALNEPGKNRCDDVLKRRRRRRRWAMPGERVIKYKIERFKRCFIAYSHTILHFFLEAVKTTVFLAWSMLSMPCIHPFQYTIKFHSYFMF